MPRRVVSIGGIRIGGGNPIAVQSMTKTKTRDVRATLVQIKRLKRAGCEIVRAAVVDRADAAALGEITARSPLPVVADIHFDHRLALAAIDAGVAKIRINPGNITDRARLAEIVVKAKQRGIPIRIGVNSGSLPRSILTKHGHPTAEAIAETCAETVGFFERLGFRDLVLSAKGADVGTTVSAYRLLHRQFDYPLHIGITEAGPLFEGTIRSSVGIGILLHEQIGDTLRVSLTADPVWEVRAAYEMLASLGLRRIGPLLISCPTCGRCEVDLLRIVKAVEKRLAECRRPITVAVMGCVVNGPGEAREADFGIACGKGIGTVFARGKEVKRVREANLVNALFEVINENVDR